MLSQVVRLKAAQRLMNSLQILPPERLQIRMIQQQLQALPITNHLLKPLLKPRPRHHQSKKD